MIGFLLNWGYKMIRFALGFLLAFGAVGGLDAGEALLPCIGLALVGLALMAWGLPKLKK